MFSSAQEQQLTQKKKRCHKINITVLLHKRQNYCHLISAQSSQLNPGLWLLIFSDALFLVQNDVDPTDFFVICFSSNYLLKFQHVKHSKSRTLFNTVLDLSEVKHCRILQCNHPSSIWNGLQHTWKVQTQGLKQENLKSDTCTKNKT